MRLLADLLFTKSSFLVYSQIMFKLRQCIVSFFRVCQRFQFVGQDAYGNRYYQKSYGKSHRRNFYEKRIVLYRRDGDITRIMPEWFGWLQGMIQHPLTSSSKKDEDPVKYDVSPIPKERGTQLNDLPYVAWTPNKKS